jgi:hypothetical protein
MSDIDERGPCQACTPQPQHGYSIRLTTVQAEKRDYLQMRQSWIISNDYEKPSQREFQSS